MKTRSLKFEVRRNGVRLSLLLLASVAFVSARLHGAVEVYITDISHRRTSPSNRLKESGQMWLACSRRRANMSR